jgi:type VI secretion system protein ImpH
VTLPAPGLDRGLLEAGFRFEFFQAVRLLERLHPERKRVGRHEDPREEVVRFRSRISMAFPASQIHGVEEGEEVRTSEEGTRGEPLDEGEEAHAARRRERDTMWVNFMGLAGIQGALPLHVTSLLSDPNVASQTAPARDFFDLFNHRLISLFYRAWEKYRFPIAYERDGRDAFTQYLYCLIGMGTPGLQGRMLNHVDPDAPKRVRGADEQILLYYAGLLAQRPRSAVALEGILQDYFGVNVEVVQFQGQWFELNTDLLTSLGAGGQNHQLGVSAVLWERIFDPQARFRVNVGPLTYRQFRDFLPGAEGYVHLVELTRFFVGEDVNFEVRPILLREEVPWCVLGQDQSIRLGWSMWLKERELDDDVAYPVFAARLAVS